MSERVLIVEPDGDFATTLVNAVSNIDATFKISAVSTLTEACLILSQDPQDVAIMPMYDNDEWIQALRALQSDLPIVVMMSITDFGLIRQYLNQVQGVVFKMHLYVDLPVVLRSALAEGPHVEKGMLPDNLTDAFPKLAPGVQMVVLAYKRAYVAHWGTLPETAVSRILTHVNKGWQDQQQTAQLQFIDLPEYSGGAMVYSQSVVNGRYRLTLVAVPQVSLSQLRSSTRRLAQATAIQEMIVAESGVSSATFSIFL